MTKSILFAHVAFMAIWFGTVAVEIYMELVLWGAKSAAKQRLIIDLHKRIDALIEVPALVLTVATGAGLMWRHGYAIGSANWPIWLEDKLMAAAMAVAANLACAVFVRLRAKGAESVLGGAQPLEHSRVRVWHMAVSATILAAPFGVIALWLAVTH